MFVTGLLWSSYVFGTQPSITGVARTEQREFHDLVEREIPKLRRYARALTRANDRADDLVRNTLLRAIAEADLWQRGTDMRAWLFTIMHNQHVIMSGVKYAKGRSSRLTKGLCSRCHNGPYILLPAA